MTTTTAAPTVANKGLRRGAIGLLGSVVLGVVQTAPAFSVAVTLAFLVGAVGLFSPALLLAGFVPILCMTVVEREFVAREPDCGTVFVWVGRSLGPRVGWICSWALLAATFISLANLANIAGTYFFLLFNWDKAAGTEWATIAVGLCWLGVATWLGVRGIELSSRVQGALLSLGLIVLAVFAVVALVKVAAGTAGAQSINPSLHWLNPFSVGSSSAFFSGMLLAIYFYWGWDGPAAVAEETRGGTATPKRALVYSALALLGFYVIVVVALQAFAGIGTKGIGLGSDAVAGDVLSPIGSAAIGSWFGTAMEFVVMLSAGAALIAALLPTARSLLSMGAYRAAPSVFAKVDERTGSPVGATVGCAIAIASVLIVLSIVSNNVLGDSISAIVLLIAFYYTLLGIAALWAFRKEITRSLGDFMSKFAAPLIGTVVLGWALIRNGKDTIADDYGLTTLLGLGGVFVIGAVTLLIGAVLMIIWNVRAPAFFRGETFAPHYLEEHRPDLVQHVRGL
ncbi:MAG TPA: APC family permease [Thermoleophilaceae bacterium]|jgi:amino acid transporter|nr:APC family permease [Thermoleophilaceae bacterium]